MIADNSKPSKVAIVIACFARSKKKILMQFATMTNDSASWHNAATPATIAHLLYAFGQFKNPRL
jgi:hypothetical protein